MVAIGIVVAVGIVVAQWLAMHRIVGLRKRDNR